MQAIIFAVVALVVVAGGGVAAMSRFEAHAQHASAARPAGCVVSVAADGYPDWYLAQPIRYTKHPPLPVPGWRGPKQPVRFDMLFHSLFHGYVVVDYRADIGATKLAMLRAWVDRHAAARVTSAPAAATRPFAVDVAEWGHELRCTNAAALTTGMLDRFISLRTT